MEGYHYFENCQIQYLYSFKEIKNSSINFTTKNYENNSTSNPLCTIHDIASR